MGAANTSWENPTTNAKFIILQAFLQLLVCESLRIAVFIVTEALKNLPFIHLKKILSCFLCFMHTTVRRVVAFG